MVTKKQQIDLKITPADVLILVLAFAFIALVAALIGLSPARVQTATYTQDAGNAGGLNNSLNTGPVAGAK
jgi:hypothetical protein